MVDASRDAWQASEITKPIVTMPTTTPLLGPREGGSWEWTCLHALYKANASQKKSRRSSNAACVSDGEQVENVAPERYTDGGWTCNDEI